VIQFLLILIFISAALSLFSYWYCWRDMAAGRPHIISLRQITGVMDRTRLDAYFGKHQSGYHYALSPQQVAGIVSRRRSFLFGECMLEGLCIFGAWWFATIAQGSSLVVPFMMLAGMCQAINLLYSFVLMRKWQHQIYEELENSED
jgi:hypothetical protein